MYTVVHSFAHLYTIVHRWAVKGVARETMEGERRAGEESARRRAGERGRGDRNLRNEPFFLEQIITDEVIELRAVCESSVDASP